MTLLPILRLSGTVFACGRDPFFPAWHDVLRLNAFEPGLRRTPWNYHFFQCLRGSNS
jgi:hypothetical protein